MEMTPSQAKLVYLTMQLELKAKEYDVLCKKLEKMKNEEKDPNCKSYQELEKKYEKILNEIAKIQKDLQKLRNKD